VSQTTTVLVKVKDPITRLPSTYVHDPSSLHGLQSPDRARGLAFQGEDTVQTARTMIMDVPAIQEHDGTPRRGAGAHSL